MNLLSPAICESRTGDLLVAWGGRRQAVGYLVLPLETQTRLQRQGMPPDQIDNVWKRRIRGESGPLVMTRIYDSGRRREDWPAATLARNPALTQDASGRVWLGYRVPVITSDDPFGAYYTRNRETPGSDGYFRTENIGTTAAMNYWQVSRAADARDFRGAFPFFWTEQVDVLTPPAAPADEFLLNPATFAQSLAAFLRAIGLGWAIGQTLGENPGADWHTSWTQHPLTGRLTLRGQGGNVMDVEEATRWRWNEPEGLAPHYSAAAYDASGRQVRVRDNRVEASASDVWEQWRDDGAAIGPALAIDHWGRRWTAGYEATLGEIPWQVARDGDVQTTPAPEVGDPLRTAWQAQQAVYAAEWATDNRREWVTDQHNARVPGQGLTRAETLDWTPEQFESWRRREEAERTRIAGEYYAAPTVGQQRPGLLVTSTGLVIVAWMHGNLVAAEVEPERHHAVGLRLAVSHDDGVSFEPLIPTREGYLNV